MAFSVALGLLLETGSLDLEEEEKKLERAGAVQKTTRIKRKHFWKSESNAPVGGNPITLLRFKWSELDR